jgi:hypothetical protein
VFTNGCGHRISDTEKLRSVVLNIAPLWELVPWKDAKKYWEELLAGKYEWSSKNTLLANTSGHPLANREKGLVK